MPSLLVYASASLALVATVTATSQPPAPAPTEPAKQSPANATITKLPAAGHPVEWIGKESPTSWQPGHLYVYECWATWCVPCLASMPHLEELHRSLAKDGNVHILGLNIENDMTPDRLRTFLESKLNVTFPLGIASNQTRDLWLTPLKVRAIPFTFALRDGEIVWKGSPRQLTAEMLQRLARGEEATDGPAPSPQQQREDMIACVRGIFEALAKDDIATAKRIAEEEDARRAKTSSSKHSMALFLLRAMAPEHPVAAVAEADDLAKQRPDDAVFLLQIANALSGVPISGEKALSKETRAVLEAALRHARRAADLEEQAGKKPRLTPLLIAGLLEKLGHMDEAKSFLLQGIERSAYGKAWEKIQQETQEGIPLAEILQGPVKAIIAMEQSSASSAEAPAAPLRWKEAATNDSMREIFKQTKWFTEFKPQAPPAEGLLLLSLQRNQKPLESLLRLRGWNRPSLQRALIACGSRLSPLTVPPGATWPIGELDDTTPLLDLLKQEGIHKTKTDRLPEVLIWKDGHLLWQGETAFIPTWLGDLLDGQPFDLTRFQNDRKNDNEKRERLTGILKQAIDFNKAGKPEEANKLLEQHLSELYDIAPLALMAEEILSGKDFRTRNYAAVGQRFQRLMKRHPQEYRIYSHIHTLLGSSAELQSAAYPAAMQALQGMADTNLRADREYDASCYAVMSQLALRQKQQARARELALRALAASELARRYLGIADEGSR